jgi:hypothetical protein
MFLEALQAWTTEHREHLEASGVEVVLADATATPKPARWLTLRRPGLEAELGLWASGECETIVGRLDGEASGQPEQTHHDLTSASELLRVLDSLAARVVSWAP